MSAYLISLLWQLIVLPHLHRFLSVHQHQTQSRHLAAKSHCQLHHFHTLVDVRTDFHFSAHRPVQPIPISSNNILYLQRRRFSRDKVDQIKLDRALTGRQIPEHSCPFGRGKPDCAGFVVIVELLFDVRSAFLIQFDPQCEWINVKIGNVAGEPRQGICVIHARDLGSEI